MSDLEAATALFNSEVQHEHDNKQHNYPIKLQTTSAHNACTTRKRETLAHETLRARTIGRNRRQQASLQQDR